MAAAQARDGALQSDSGLGLSHHPAKPAHGWSAVDRRLRSTSAFLLLAHPSVAPPRPPGSRTASTTLWASSSSSGLATAAAGDAADSRVATLPEEHKGEQSEVATDRATHINPVTDAAPAPTLAAGRTDGVGATPVDQPAEGALEAPADARDDGCDPCDIAAKVTASVLRAALVHALAQLPPTRPSTHIGQEAGHCAAESPRRKVLLLTDLPAELLFAIWLDAWLIDWTGTTACAWREAHPVLAAATTGPTAVTRAIIGLQVRGGPAVAAQLMVKLGQRWTLARLGRAMGPVPEAIDLASPWPALAICPAHLSNLDAALSALSTATARAFLEMTVDQAVDGLMRLALMLAVRHLAQPFLIVLAALVHAIASLQTEAGQDRPSNDPEAVATLLRLGWRHQRRRGPGRMHPLLGLSSTSETDIDAWNDRRRLHRNTNESEDGEDEVDESVASSEDEDEDDGEDDGDEESRPGESLLRAQRRLRRLYLACLQNVEQRLLNVAVLASNHAAVHFLLRWCPGRVTQDGHVSLGSDASARLPVPPAAVELAASALNEASGRISVGLLNEAARRNDGPMVDLLIKGGADPCAAASRSLRDASYWGHGAAVKALLQGGADVADGENHAFEALLDAAVAGHEEVVALLIAHGADVHAGEDSALWSAVTHRHLSLAKLLLMHGANPHARAGAVFHQALRLGDQDLIRLLLHAILREPEPPTHLGDGTVAGPTALTPQPSVAAEVAGELRNRTSGHSSSANFQPTSSPLRWPAWLSPSKRTAGALAPATMAAQPKGAPDRRRALHRLDRALIAACDGQTQAYFVSLLLEHGADPAAEEHAAVRKAAAYNQVAVLKLLAAAGADLLTDDNVALTLAAAEGAADAVDYLLSQGACASAQASAALRATVKIAAPDTDSVLCAKKDKLVTVLLDAGADVTAVDFEAIYTAAQAVFSGSSAVMDLSQARADTGEPPPPAAPAARLLSRLIAVAIDAQPVRPPRASDDAPTTRSCKLEKPFSKQHEGAKKTLNDVLVEILVQAAAAGAIGAIDVILPACERRGVWRPDSLAATSALCASVQYEHEQVVRRLLQAGADVLAYRSAVLHSIGQGPAPPSAAVLALLQAAATECDHAALVDDHGLLDLKATIPVRRQTPPQQRPAAASIPETFPSMSEQAPFDPPAAVPITPFAHNCRIPKEVQGVCKDLRRFSRRYWWQCGLDRVLFHLACGDHTVPLRYVLVHMHPGNWQGGPLVWASHLNAGVAALVGSAALGHLRAARLLLDHGVPASAQDSLALRWAAAAGRQATVLLLLERGASVHASEDGALRAAAAQGHLDVVRLLLDKGARASACQSEALRVAAAHGYVDVVRLLLGRGADLHACGEQALIRAAQSGHADVVALLLEKGANVHAQQEAALRAAARGPVPLAGDGTVGLCEATDQDIPTGGVSMTAQGTALFAPPPWLSPTAGTSSSKSALPEIPGSLVASVVPAASATLQRVVEMSKSSFVSTTEWAWSQIPEGWQHSTAAVLAKHVWNRSGAGAAVQSLTGVSASEQSLLRSMPLMPSPSLVIWGADVVTALTALLSNCTSIAAVPRARPQLRRTVSLLLAAGADPSARHHAALVWAAWHGLPDVATLLCTHGADPHAQGGGALRAAAARGSAATVDVLCDHLNARRVPFSTVLWQALCDEASAAGHAEVVTLLQTRRPAPV